MSLPGIIRLPDLLHGFGLAHGDQADRVRDLLGNAEGLDCAEDCVQAGGDHGGLLGRGKGRGGLLLVLLVGLHLL